MALLQNIDDLNLILITIYYFTDNILKGILGNIKYALIRPNQNQPPIKKHNLSLAELTSLAIFRFFTGHRNWKDFYQHIKTYHKKVYSLQLIKNELVGKGLEGKYISSHSNPFLGIAIRLKNVKTDAELDKLIKDNYGLRCCVGEKNLWEPQNEVYEVAIQGEGENKEIGISNPDCPVNYAVKILYNPEKGKVMYVTLGQESVFYGASPDYRDYGTVTKPHLIKN